jgi:hypothetical protein
VVFRKQCGHCRESALLVIAPLRQNTGWTSPDGSAGPTPGTPSQQRNKTKRPHNFNHEDGYKLNKAWLHLFPFKPTTTPPLNSEAPWTISSSPYTWGETKGERNPSTFGVVTKNLFSNLFLDMWSQKFPLLPFRDIWPPQHFCVT